MKKIKKRKKRSRLRGSKTAFWGARKNHKKSGHRGGKGMAGTGKRAGQKKTWVLAKQPDYLGKEGLKSKREKIKVVNVEYIQKNLNKLVKKGKAKKTGKGYEVDLGNHKLLGKGEIKEKVIVKCKEVSKSAKQKIEKVNGEIILPEKKQKKNDKQKKSDNKPSEKETEKKEKNSSKK